VVAGREQVKASWSVSFGWDDKTAPTECADYYRRWPQHQAPSLWDADPAELRRYAAFLASLPPKYAGDDPATVPAGEEQDQAEPVEGGGPKLTAKQRTTIQAALAKMFNRDRKAKLEFLSSLVGRVLESSNELSVREASDVIDALMQDQTSPGAGVHAERAESPTGPESPSTAGMETGDQSGSPRTGDPAPGDPTTPGED